MFFTKKVRRDLLAAINERVHEKRLEVVYDYLSTLQTELATLKKQVKILLEEKETVWPSLRHSCGSELTRQGISLP